MKGILVVTHGKLAEELVNAFRVIVSAPAADGFASILAASIDWETNIDDAKALIGKSLSQLGRSDVLILTDMFGGTPTNLAVLFATEGVEVVTGVNLPMLVKASQVSHLSAVEAARIVRDQGRESIQVAGDLLGGKGPSPGAKP